MKGKRINKNIAKYLEKGVIVVKLAGNILLEVLAVERVRGAALVFFIWNSISDFSEESQQ